MSRRPKSLPHFRNEAEERRFWETHDSIGDVEWSKAERVRLPNLKPSTTSISLRACRSACWNRSRSQQTGATFPIRR